MPGSPGLSAQGWRKVLELEGFRSILLPVSEAQTLGQQIVVAESDGVIRLKQAEAGFPPEDNEASVIARSSATICFNRITGEFDGRGWRATHQSEGGSPSGSIGSHQGEDRCAGSDSELSEYGFDSITFTMLTHQLNELYGLNLMPTIFFEQPTLNAFARYLVEKHRAVFATRFAPSIKKPAVEVEQTVAAQMMSQRQLRDRARPAARRPALTPRAEPVADAIAVIGMSGRFPMAEDVAAFWRNLVEERDCIVEVPKARWDWRAVYGDPLKEANKTNIKWGGFIDGIDEFDPLFFGISPREAELMDPQQRLLMTYVWKAIEDAAIRRRACRQ